MRNFLRFPDFKDKAVTLSYDDGVRQDKRLCAIMKQNGLKGTFNINSGMFSPTYSGEEKGRMTREEVLETYADCEVAVHGVQHLSLTQVDKGMAVNDVINDRKELERLFGTIVKGMAYANGSYNDEVISILRNCGINYARTVITTEDFKLPDDWLRMETTCHHKNPRLMVLAKKFVEYNNDNIGYFWAKAPKLFFLWGHSYEFDNDNNWNVIEEFAEYIGNRDDIWYATNGELFDYVQAFERLEYSVDGTMIHNPTTTDVYLHHVMGKVVVRAGETIRM